MKYYNIRTNGKALLVGKGVKSVTPRKMPTKGCGKLEHDAVKEEKVGSAVPSTPSLDGLRQALSDTRLSGSAHRLGVAKKIRL